MAAAGESAVCEMCRPYIEMSTIRSYLGTGYVLVDLDECPMEAIRRYIHVHGNTRKRPRPGASGNTVRIRGLDHTHGVDCDHAYEFPTAIKCKPEAHCVFCEHVSKTTTAEEVASVLGGIRELGETCVDFLGWRRCADGSEPAPALPRTPTGEIDWDGVQCSPVATHRAPGPATRVVSRVGAFRPFTVFRTFSLGQDQLLFRAAMSDQSNPSEFVVWREPRHPRPHVLPLLNQALHQFMARPRAPPSREDLRKPPAYVNASWNGYSAQALFFWDEDDHDSPYLSRLYFAVPEGTQNPWSFSDGSNGPKIGISRASPVGIIDLTLDSTGGNTMIMGVRQGRWVYRFYFNDCVGIDEFAWVIMERCYNLEELCETPPPCV